MSMGQTLLRNKLRLWPFIVAVVVAALLAQIVFMIQSASAAVTSVQIGASTRSVDGTDVPRGANQLILYTYSTSQTRTPTNQYGIEVAVGANHVITAVNHRLQTGSTAGTTIPSGGYVLSGHGWGVSTSGYTWLLNNARVGLTVTQNGVTPPPSDTTVPTTSLTAPVNGSSTALGAAVNISANASDNVGVTKVEFFVDGAVVATDTSSPYSYSWGTAGRSAGSYSLTAKAYDAASNVGTSDVRTVVLVAPTGDNGGYNSDGVKLSKPAVTLNGNKVTYNWSVETNKSVTFRYLQVAVRPSGDTGFNPDTTINGARSFTSTHTLANGTYTAFAAYFLVSTNTWVNGPSVEYTVGNTTAPSDTIAPTTSITAPVSGSSATVGSTVNVAANASDNVGVSKVDFLVNGSVVSTDTTAPYGYVWNTSGRAAGTYALNTKAYDAVGNVGTSSAVQIALTTPQISGSGDWLSGVATMEDGNGADPAKYFSDWRGTPVEIGQTWPNTPDVWGVNPSVANSWAGFQGPMSLSYTPGSDWNGLQGWRSWSATARGDMDAWWRAAAQQTKTFRQGKGTTYVSPFYEYNGDWMSYSVPRTTQGMADFRAGWERVSNIWRQEFPGVKMVLPAACSRDVPAAMMPSSGSYDHVGCTIYNAWPWKADGSEAVRLLEIGRQRAQANGKSLVITEWANSGNGSAQGGGGDAPGFIAAMHSYFQQNGGTGAGRLEFETFFNIDGYELDHILLRKNGSQLVVNSSQPQTAAKYQQLF